MAYKKFAARLQGWKQSAAEGRLNAFQFHIATRARNRMIQTENQNHRPASLPQSSGSIMNRSELFGYGLAVALCFVPVCQAEEAAPLTNVGELSMIEMADTCAKVFEIGEQHRRRGRVASALDSFAWVVVNLPDAPPTEELNTKNAEAFVSALESENRSEIAAFGDERAIRYLNRMISDARLLLPLKKRAQDIKNTLQQNSKRGTNQKALEIQLEKLVAALNEDGGWWQNGLYAPIHLPADAKAEDVLNQALQFLDEGSPLKKGHEVLAVREVTINKKAFLAVLLDYPHGSAIFLCEHDNDGSWWTRFIPFPNEEKNANENANEANTWSEPINGLQARLTIQEEPKVNGTRLLVPFLELRNVRDLASPMEVNCERQFLKIELVDAEGKEIKDRGSLSRSGPIPILNTIILPAHSSIRISLECRNWGVPKDAAAMVATDSGAWIIGASEKGKVYLRATLTGDKGEPDYKKWHGRIQTPLLAINWK